MVKKLKLKRGPRSSRPLRLQGKILPTIAGIPVCQLLASADFVWSRLRVILDLQIACNTGVQEGMVISNQSEKVKDAVKWGLDFHLINHPLDCPICDQAGECGLQEQYMHFGKYDPEMGERKVKKRKVVDLGERVVLDTERCILCSRCVRFTDEISKTNELGIFNRGDHSEIGTFADKPLNNNYSLNTVDICPVGALTSKDFRFRQRVWFLQDKPSICTGCSTGCNVDVYYNREGVWRVKPRHSEVNGYWMCDEGRNIYKSTNLFATKYTGERDNKKTIKVRNRLTQGLNWVDGGKENNDPVFALSKMSETIGKYEKNKVALVVTGQYTCEELDSLVGFWKGKFSADSVYHWLNYPDKLDEFDGLLVRGDKNPNTAGVKKVFADHGVNSDWKNLEASLNDGTVDFLMVAGPENQWCYPDLSEKLSLFLKASQLVYLTSCWLEDLDEKITGSLMMIPTKSFAEKSGTFINYEGKEQKFEKVETFVDNAMYLNEVADLLAGKALGERDHVNVGQRVINEFVHHRGDL